ncbi:MAG: type II toxin-antitoxin system prevent-host-death family antitoxin [Candidatus Dormibacteraeota bacterium]|nr:type II toxin-antitoxin system prevent-host-death family antitoxin [Candidatus Dormibacteraeota bacterium]
MERIGVRELNQQTSRVIDRVARGEILEITDRGRPVARLVPVMALPEPLEQLVAEGRAVPATVWGPIPVPPVDAADGVDVAAELASLRDEER